MTIVITDFIVLYFIGTLLYEVSVIYLDMQVFGLSTKLSVSSLICGDTFLT